MNPFFKMRMSIGTKLLLGVVFIVFVLGGFGLQLTQTLNAIRYSFSELDRRYAVLKQISSLEAVHAIQADAMKSYMLSKNPQWEEAYDNASLEFDTRMNELESALLGEEQAVAFHRFSDLAHELRGLELLIFDAINDGDAETAQMLFDAEYAQRELDSLQYLADLRIQAESSVTEIIQQNRIVILFSENILVAFLVILIILITTIALIFSYLLSASLRDLKSAVEDIMAGDLNRRARIRSRDEIGGLARAFNEMTAKLQASYQGLEEKVKDRTEELRRNMSSLNTAKARDEAILESIGDGVLVTDREGMILFLNQTASDMLCKNRDECLYKKVDHVIRAFDSENRPIEGGDRPYAECLRTGKRSVARDLLYARPDETHFPVAITATPILLDNRVIGVVEIIRDITHEKDVDRAKTEFVSLASHQLRGPLTSIKWNSQMLLDGEAGKLEPKQQNVVQDVLQSGQNMISLVNKLLNISRIELGTFIIEPETAHLRDIAEKSLTELKEEIQAKHLKLSTVYPKTIIPVKVDANLAGIIFQNLISNAIKYTPEGGSVEMSFTRSGDEIIFAVKDSGIGIPEKSKPHIFEKLYRADNAEELSVEGNGLGLYMVKQIADKSGCRIWFESTEGKGTTFYVAIPLSGMQEKSGTRTLA